MDSAGRAIAIGDKVKWRGQIYTIKAFGPRVGIHNLHAIEFEEPLHCPGEPDEFGVDRVS